MHIFLNFRRPYEFSVNSMQNHPLFHYGKIRFFKNWALAYTKRSFLLIRSFLYFSLFSMTLRIPRKYHAESALASASEPLSRHSLSPLIRLSLPWLSLRMLQKASLGMRSLSFAFFRKHAFRVHESSILELLRGSGVASWAPLWNARPRLYGSWRYNRGVPKKVHNVNLFSITSFFF